MARNVRLAALSSYPNPSDCPRGLEDSVEQMVAFWRRALTPVLQQQPDLVVLPEVCDRWHHHGVDERRAFFDAKGDRVQRMLCEQADAANCIIAYPTIAYEGEATYNTIRFIAGGHGVIGQYHKCVLTPGEVERWGLTHGDGPVVLDTSLGRVGGAVCFDLNFDPLMDAYRGLCPEIMVFPSMYHGGHKRLAWAYGCRSYFVGAIARLPSYVISPLGEVVAESSNYHPYVIADVNLDFCVLHLDENWDKLARIRERYGRGVKLHDPGFLGAVMLTAEANDLSIQDIVGEYQIELLDSYLARSWSSRQQNVDVLIAPR